MWAKIDDQILDNPKIAGLSPEAKLTYFAAIVHCKQQMTDGLIATPLLPLVLCKAHPTYIGQGEMIADELVAAGLWEATEAGWLMHDWLDWNQSAAEIRERAAAAKERKRQYAERKRAEGVANTGHEQERVARRVADTRIDADATDAGTSRDALATTISDIRYPISDIRESSELNQPPSASARGDRAPPDPPKPAAKPFESDFDPLWQRYPRRMYRAKALKAFQALMRRTSGDRSALLVELAAATGHYADAKATAEARHVMHGATWFGPDEPWRDWVHGDPEPAAGSNGNSRPDPFDALAARLEEASSP